VSLLTAALTDSVKALALELGFDLVTAGPAGPPEHGPALRDWLEAGHAGTMGYLERRVEERLDPARVLPDAHSVLCVALNYFGSSRITVGVPALKRRMKGLSDNGFRESSAA